MNKESPDLILKLEGLIKNLRGFVWKKRDWKRVGINR